MESLVTAMEARFLKRDNCYRNHHAKFEIDRTIFTRLN